MPGILDSILNIGICDKTVSGLLRMTGNPRFVWDSYRRLIETYASVVYDCSIAEFTSNINTRLKDDGAIGPDELDVDTLKHVVNDYLKIFEEQTRGIPFPQQPDNIRGLAGTAVTVQTMVFGNMDQTSGSGVAFTRNPSTGENNLYAEFLFNAQGEDIVSGERLEKLLPEAYKELQIAGKRLERHFKDLQDFEFTIQRGNLFILQSRNGKRTPWAALVIAVDMVNDNLIDTQTALRRLELYDLEKVERRIIVSSRSGAKNIKDNHSTKNVEVLANGVPASPGIAIGKIALDYKKAKEITMTGKPTISIRTEISTDDISGIAK